MQTTAELLRGDYAELLSTAKKKSTGEHEPQLLRNDEIRAGVAPARDAGEKAARAA